MEWGSETSSIKKGADDPALDSHSVLNVGKATVLHHKEEWLDSMLEVFKMDT